MNRQLKFPSPVNDLKDDYSQINNFIRRCKKYIKNSETLYEKLSYETPAPTISLGSHQNIGLHTGARANVVLLTYLLITQSCFFLRVCIHNL